jgi:hypothetical protein
VEPLEDRTVPTAVAPPSGLVSWWTADNTAADLKGLNNATLYNGTTYAAGQVQQAFSFDGVDDRAEVADADSLKFTNSMSIEGWILVRGYSTTTHGFILFRGDDRGGLDPYTLSIETNGKLTCQVNNGNASSSVAAPVPLGQLVHVAATLDDATGSMKLYENGAVVAQTATAVRPFRDLDPASNPGIGIGNANGSSPSSYNAPFNGLIDELSVYNRALTAGEVQGIYSAGSDGKIKTSTYIAADFPSVVEGPAGSTTPVSFTLQRVGNLSGQAVVNWTTADGTATAGSDYVAASGQVVFQAGESQKTVPVTVLGDDTPEANETFQLLLSTTTPGYAVGMGLATITEDDVGVSVDDGTATEGDGRLGQSLGAFVSQSDNGGMNRSAGMAWGPDGKLYVGSLNTNQVLRFDGTTGASLGTFIDGVDSPAVEGLVFRPDGLYVLSRNAATVQRFDATTGAFLGVFIPAGSRGAEHGQGDDRRPGRELVPQQRHEPDPPLQWGHGGIPRGLCLRRQRRSEQPPRPDVRARRQPVRVQLRLQRRAALQRPDRGLPQRLHPGRQRRAGLSGRVALLVGKPVRRQSEHGGGPALRRPNRGVPQQGRDRRAGRP